MKNLLKYECLDVVDIGTGTNSFSSTLEHCGFNVTALDFKKGHYWSTFLNRHIHVINDDITKTRIFNKFDAVLCISTLEHISDFKNAVFGMVKKMKENGILVMTFPYTHDDYCENVYKLDDADRISKSFNFIGQSFSKEEIDDFCKDFNLNLVETQYIKGWSSKYWRTGQRYNFPRKVQTPMEANAGCFLFKKK